ncbi:MAG: carbon-nitrogen hydrolase family protein [Proteobacteria bacterium]|nr:carbon-nitrogen hydrolase family protein [Pseudomonadota bacterium]
MSGKFKVACIQTNARREVAESIALIAPMIREARAQGAELICTPEMTDMIEPKRKLQFEKAKREAEHEGLAGLRALARETGAWLLVGSLAVKLDDGSRLANRSYLFDPAGEMRASYDKIHMFDVDLAGGESYRESSAFRPGERAVLVETPWGPLGMTVCYDLRFAHLYRSLAQAGAMYLTIPAAFTRPTGRAHWHVLMRARAIECGAYVFAPAQCGEHAEGRKTYGHSLIVAPWGEILAEGGDEVGVITAEIDPAKVHEARRMVPALTHDRPFAPPTQLRAIPLREAGE